MHKSLSPSSGGDVLEGGSLAGLAELHRARSTDSYADSVLGLSLSLCNEWIRKEGFVLGNLTKIGELSDSTNTLKCI